MAALGLHCCAWAFSSCGEQGLCSGCGAWASHHCGGSHCRAQAQQLWHSGFSCSVAGGIFPDQGSNLCARHWQMDSYVLYHQGRPQKDS